MKYRNIMKFPLNKVTHSVRAAQAVLQYGVGAMVDFPDQTLITAAPETWSKTQRIYDDRFAKALSVDYFALPTKISYSRFPEWYFCPKCEKFQPIDKWVAEYQNHSKVTARANDNTYMTRYVQCVKCKQDLVVARIVTVCEHGHLNDFPWIKWVHRKSNKPICNDPSLKFKSRYSSTEGLEGLGISCSCGAYTTLSSAFDRNSFEKLDRKAGENIFRCEGGHPHKHKNENCDLYPRTVQRGSSSVYFPVIFSSLVVPPYTDKLNSKIEKSEAFDNCITIIKDEDPEDRIDKITKRLNRWVGDIATEIGVPPSSVEAILRRKWLDEGEKEVDVTGVKYRAQEYEALSGEITAHSGPLGDFSREGISKDLFQDRLPYIKAVSLIDKVRVVNALIGFSRINPISGKNDKGFVHIKESETPWYPAYEVRGEGIFIEFEQSDIDAWLVNNPMILERTKRINDNYANSFFAQNHSRTITPKFLLLHTVSHLLIKQLSFECGYSIASLSERLYCSEKSDGREMSGIFIYTASGDSEGTLGGLVRQGRPDAFPKIFKKAIDGARTCSSDPVCVLSRGQGRDSLNLAACHTCALLPETCCEERNGFLDRGVVIGTYENPQMGFYSRL